MVPSHLEQAVSHTRALWTMWVKLMSVEVTGRSRSGRNTDAAHGRVSARLVENSAPEMPTNLSVLALCVLKSREHLAKLRRVNCWASLHRLVLRRSVRVGLLPPAASDP